MLKASGVLNTEDREEEIKQIEVYKSHSKFMKTKVWSRVRNFYNLGVTRKLGFTCMFLPPNNPHNLLYVISWDIKKNVQNFLVPTCRFWKESWANLWWVSSLLPAQAFLLSSSVFPLSWVLSTVLSFKLPRLSSICCFIKLLPLSYLVSIPSTRLSP